MRFSKGIFTALVALTLNTAGVAAAPAVIEGGDARTGAAVKVASGEKGLVVVFLSATCPCSHSHVAELKDLALSHGDFRFVAIHSNQDEDADISRRYFVDQNLPFPVVSDVGGKYADQFRALRTPHAFVFNKSGEIVFKGGVTDSSDSGKANQKYLRAALADIRSGKKVRVSSARPLGCAIARR